MAVLQWLRGMATPALDLLFQAVTVLGEQLFLAGLFCLVYWCLHKELGRALLTGLCFTTCLNGLVKDLVRAPRPFWVGAEAVAADTATGYSFPSGHSQASATFYGSLALWLRRAWVWALCLLVILAVCFSRIYLGVHFPRDVAAGLLLGLGTAVLVRAVLVRLSLGAMLVLCAVMAGVCLPFAQSHDTYAAVGLTLGMIPGIWLEARLVDFAMPAGFWRGLLRLCCGGVLLGLIYFLPRLVFERSNALYLIRNAVIAFVCVGGYPWLFTRLGRRSGGNGGGRYHYRPIQY